MDSIAPAKTSEWTRKTEPKAADGRPSRFGGFWVDNDFTIRKGKHKGMSLFDVKSSYFSWMLNEPELAAKMGELEKEVIGLLLTYRRKKQEAKEAEKKGALIEQQEADAGSPLTDREPSAEIQGVSEVDALYDDLPF